MVIDATMWFAETDMMRLRIAMLDDLVDTFVVVEADRTHTGIEKGWHLPDDIRSHPKVVYRQVTLTAAHPWGRENEQRRAMRDAVGWCEPSPDTLVAMSDCDELWDERFTAADGLRVAVMDFRLFSVFWRYPTPWNGTIGGPWSLMGEADWQSLRDQRWMLRGVRSGWHLSWMGDDTDRDRKLASFAHTELADRDIRQAVGDARWFDGRELVEVDDLPDRLVGLCPEPWRVRRVP